MRIIINTGLNIVGGGLQVAISFLKECRSNNIHEYHVYLNCSIAQQVEQSLFPKNFYFYYIHTKNIIGYCKLCRDLESKIKPDIVFTLFGPSYWIPKSMHIQGFARGYYIYPESPFWQMCNRSERLHYYLYKIIHLWLFKISSSAYVCETEDVTRRIKHKFGKNKIYYTVSNTCSSIFLNNNKDRGLFDALPTKKHMEFRFLTLTRYYKHKRIELIRDIVDKLVDLQVLHIKFIITISDCEYKRIFSSNYNEYVINIGHINIEECPSLYRSCDAAFIPTTIECFSASYPEAMAMRTPILTSDLDFARAICKDAAVYFDYKSLDDVVQKIIQLSTDKQMQERLKQNGSRVLSTFPSASKRAQLYLDMCEDILKKKHGNN